LPNLNRCVVRAIFAHDAFHLVFQMELQLLQAQFLGFFLLCQERLVFELSYKLLIGLVLVSEVTKLIAGLHQVRLNVVLCVPFHVWATSPLSGVAAPSARSEYA
jgi:hypothetical protein